MDLTKQYKQHTGKATGKFEHYLGVYEKYFSSFRETPVNVVEVGVAEGGSLEVWYKYFGSLSRIIGIDAADKTSLKFDPPGAITVLLGNQGDREFWKRTLPQIGPIDIFIDDGGHVSSEQIVTFEEVWPYVRDGGIYICEDLQTSYFSNEPFCGGYKAPGSFIEYLKKIIDEMNAWATDGREDFRITDLTRTVKAINFYPFLVVLEKGNTALELHSAIMRGGQHVH